MVVWEMIVPACGVSLHWVVGFRISLEKFPAQSASTYVMQGDRGNIFFLFKPGWRSSYCNKASILRNTEARPVSQCYPEELCWHCQTWRPESKHANLCSGPHFQRSFIAAARIFKSTQSNPQQTFSSKRRKSNKMKEKSVINFRGAEHHIFLGVTLALGWKPAPRLRVVEATSRCPAATRCPQRGRTAGLQIQGPCFCPGPVPSSVCVRQVSECC